MEVQDAPVQRDDHVVALVQAVVERERGPRRRSRTDDQDPAAGMTPFQDRDPLALRHLVLVQPAPGASPVTRQVLEGDPGGPPGAPTRSGDGRDLQPQGAFLHDRRIGWGRPMISGPVPSSADFPNDAGCGVIVLGYGRPCT